MNASVKQFLSDHPESLTQYEQSKTQKDWEGFGLTLSQSGYYEASVIAFSKAIACEPFTGISYRHRGHRYISTRRFAESTADFSMASRLIPENWDVWYHYGLALFLQGDYQQAVAAYKVCYDLSYDEESLVAISNWLWITYKRTGNDQKAQALLDKIKPDLDIEENIGYYNLLKLYKGIYQADEIAAMLDGGKNALNVVTMGFGLANYYGFTGSEEKRQATLDLILEETPKEWNSAFGFIAAEVDSGI